MLFVSFVCIHPKPLKYPKSFRIPPSKCKRNAFRFKRPLQRLKGNNKGKYETVHLGY